MPVEQVVLEIGSWEIVILALVQGITEFLPISSSGHLVLFESLMNLPVENLKNFDVVVHVGTLLSILVYFWSDVWLLFLGFFKALKGKKVKKSVLGVSPIKFIWFLVIGTIPAVIVGLGFEKEIDGFFRDPHTVGYAFLATAFWFIFAEWIAGQLKSRRMNSWRSIFVGIFQALAIIPGVSRSGSTIAAGLSTGITRSEAAKFSFLLGIPALLGAGILTAFKLNFGVGPTIALHSYLVGFFVSFLSGYAAIYVLMKFLKKHSLAWFSVYLIPLGLYLLA